jgi:hypothetical protein
LASNHGQRLYYCFRSNCFPVLDHRGCRRGHSSHSLLLPYLSYPHLRSGSDVLSSESWSGIGLLGRRRGLLIDDGS